MRVPLTAIAVLLSTTGCAALRGGGARERVAAGAHCSAIPVPLDPSLAGLDLAARAALLERASSGLVAVAYVPVGCDVRLTVLPTCRAPGTYAYRAAGKREQRLIIDEGALLEVLPLGGSVLSEALRKQGALRLDALRVGRLEATGKGKKLGVLTGAECERATHVIAAIDLGEAVLTAGPDKLLAGDTGFLDRRPPRGIELLERIGGLEGCTAALRERRTGKGCAAPLRLTLVPLGGELAPARVQPAIASQGGSEGPEMISIPASELWMGNDLERSEAPRRRVQLDAFSIDAREVTAAEYDACARAGGCTPAARGGACTSGVEERAEHPINCVTWAQARQFCERRGARLPTEAEWERAARGIDGRPFVWGDTWPPPEGVANLADLSARVLHPFWAIIPGYDDGYPETSPAGAFDGGRSPVGARDLAGNVMEWTADWYSERTYPKAGVKNPKGPAGGEGRVVRGSSFGQSRATQVSVTARAGYRAELTSIHIGFRCAGP